MVESDQEQDFSRRFAHELNMNLRVVRRILRRLNVDDQEKDVRGQYWPVRTLDDGKKRRSSPSHVRKLVRAYRNIEIALEEGKYSRALSLADDNNNGRRGLPKSFLEYTAKTAFEGSLEAGKLRARGMYAQDDYYDAIAAAWEEFKVAQECLKKDYHPGDIDERRDAAEELVKALMGADLYAKMDSVLNMKVGDVRLFSEKEERGYKGEATNRLRGWISDISEEGPVVLDDVAFVKRLAHELGNGAYEKGLANLVKTYANDVKDHNATGARIARLRSDYDQRSRVKFLFF